MTRKRLSPDIEKKATKTVGRFLAYCSIMKACRAYPRLRHGGPVALVLVLPAGAEPEDFEKAAFVALNAHQATNNPFVDACRIVYASEQWWRNKASSAKPHDIFKVDRVLILAKSINEVPEQVLAAVDGVVTLPSPEPRHVIAAARVCLRQRAGRQDAEAIAAMPHSLISLMMRRSRTVSQALEAMRKASSPSGSPSRTRPLRLADLKGYGEAADWGRELAVDLEDWQDGRIKWTDVDRGILISGPPGTGKTTFARALAASCDVHLVLGSLSRWQARGHLGDLLKAMRAAFREAKDKAPSILFIDEIDAFGDRERFSDHNAQYCTEVVAGLLECIDGAEGNEGVVVVGACNHPDRLDAAIVRPGRLDRHIRIPLPDEQARTGILRWHLDGVLKTADLNEVANRTAGWSGAGLEQLVRDGRRRARRERRDIVLDDLLASLPPLVKIPEPLLRRAAIHEAGHAVIATVLGLPFDHVEISDVVALDADATYLPVGGVRMRRNPFQEQTAQTLLDEICVILGGIAAEEVLIGNRSLGAGGAIGSDLHLATMTALRLEASYGLGKGLAFLSTDDDDELLAILQRSHIIRERVEAILGEQMNKTTTLVRERKGDLDRIGRMLLEQKRITAADVARLVSGVDSARRLTRADNPSSVPRPRGEGISRTRDAMPKALKFCSIREIKRPHNEGLKMPPASSGERMLLVVRSRIRERVASRRRGRDVEAGWRSPCRP